MKYANNFRNCLTVRSYRVIEIYGNRVLIVTVLIFPPSTLHSCEFNISDEFVHYKVMNKSWKFRIL